MTDREFNAVVVTVGVILLAILYLVGSIVKYISSQ